MGEAVEITNRGESDAVVIMPMSQVRRRSSVTFQPIQEETTVKEDNQKPQKDVYSVSIRRESIALVNLQDNQEFDLAHNFEDHSYSSPTDCGMCRGLLVGLWSQGLQCRMCGLNVHRGGGIGDHDDCRAEAMFAPCTGCKTGDDEVDKSLGEAIQELQQLAQNQPDFFGDVRSQMDRDVMTHVSDTIVTAGVEGEKTKKFARAKAKIIPILEFLDAFEDYGRVFCVLHMLRIHAMVAFISASIGFVFFAVAIVSRHHDKYTLSSLHLALIHESTVLATVYVVILLFVLCARYLAKLLRRKAILVDRFLRDKLTIDAKEDFGVSVPGAAGRAVWWSETTLVSAAITCYAALSFWWVSQPFFDTLEAIDQPTCKVET